MKEIMVEGFKVIIEKEEGKFIASVPKLPGCIAQADHEEDVPRQMRKLIGLYLAELASRKPGIRGRNAEPGAGKRSDGEPPGKIKK
ncbi:type II toxin-antitoxin system HicB family antitoxin [Candidatus Micrarchaeota archaeon]|nr:type II toxin-antitoxin system HicB family antitoxin [Candidatus Micrarchaeota archaeon]